MGRRLVKEPDAAQQLVDGFLEGKTKRVKKRPTNAKASLKNAIKDIEGRMESRDWSDMKPSTFVGLHAWMHEQVYNAPLSMTQREMVAACGQAKRRREELKQLRLSESVESLTR